MARNNSVFHYGRVAGDPKIIRDNESGEYLRGMAPIEVIKGVRSFGGEVENMKYDCPVIMSGNDVYIKEMATWKKNDMVEVKGAITTKDIVKSTKCSECGAKNLKNGTVVFINPIYLSRRETGLRQEECYELLKQRCEISNSVSIIGTLCKEPEHLITPKGTDVTQYQLAVNRKYRIKEDLEDIRTDYPWVKTFGPNAIKDFNALSVNSVVLIDGAIQTRQVEQTTTCSDCGHKYKWKDSAMEIVPYAVEYLQNFELPETTAERKEEELKDEVEKALA